MEKTTALTREGLFNLIAPIHIYHKADIYFKKEARKAFKELKKLRNEEVISHYFEDNISILSERSVSNVEHEVFWKIYDTLFQELVEEEFPTLKATHDRYGAKCFKNEGNMVLAGDIYDCFPFYESSIGLKERLEDLSQELH